MGGSEGRERRAAGAARPARVLLLTPHLLDTRDGRSATDLALGLARKGHEPTVCCYAGWGPLAEELRTAGVEIFPLRRRPGIDATFPFALATEVRRRRIDVVHTLHARKAYLIGAIAAFLGGGARRIATFREVPPPTPRLLRLLGRLSGELMNAVLATSEAVHLGLLRQRWVPPGKVQLISDGVNLERFSDPGRRDPARDLWRVARDAPLVGAVLRSDREEEQRLVRNAFTVVRTRLPKARLVTAGLDRSGDDLRNLGPYADSPAFFAAIDVLCVPFAERRVPLTLLEGLAAGTPVVASLHPADFGRAPEGPWAFANITEPGSAALGKGLLQMLLDPAYSSPLVRGGHACVATDYAFDRYLETMTSIYG